MRQSHGRPFHKTSEGQTKKNAQKVALNHFMAATANVAHHFILLDKQTICVRMRCLSTKHPDVTGQGDMSPLPWQPHVTITRCTQLQGQATAC
jgi:hypothetical protein